MSNVIAFPREIDVRSLLTQTQGWISTKRGKRCLTAKHLLKLGIPTNGVTPHARTLSSVYFKVDDFPWGPEFLQLEERDRQRRIQADEEARKAHEETQKAYALMCQQEHEKELFALKDAESYTSSDLRVLGWSQLAEERFLDKRLFDIVPSGAGYDHVYPGDYIRALHLRKERGRLIVDDIPAPAAVKKTTWLMQKDVLKRGWKRKDIQELLDPIVYHVGRYSIHWFRLDAVEAIEKQRKAVN